MEHLRFFLFKLFKFLLKGKKTSSGNYLPEKPFRVLLKRKEPFLKFANRAIPLRFSSGEKKTIWENCYRETLTVGKLKKGFTLLETVAALIIISVSFGFLLYLMSSLYKNYTYTVQRWKDFNKLDYGYKSGKMFGIKGYSTRWPEYGVSVLVFTYGNITYYEILP